MVQEYSIAHRSQAILYSLMMCDVQVVVVMLLLLLLLSTNTFATEPSRTATGSAFVPSPCLSVQMLSLY
jgi:hypothetical protein